MRALPPWALAVCCLLSGACAATKHDYSAYRQHLPRSILVLPPLNNSTDVNASYVYLSTVSQPLADCGYYVFPVAMVDGFMKENGLPGPGEMHAVPLDKLRDVFGADAVLYVTIEEWGQKYLVLTSTTVVRAKAELVDTVSKTSLWSGTAYVSEGSGGAESGLIGMAVAAIVDQIVDTMTDRVHDVAGTANRGMIFNANDGFLYGPYHPQYDSDSRGR